MEVALDLWIFFRPFLFGALGGLAAILMSHVQRDSAIAEVKSKLTLKYKKHRGTVTEILDEALKQSEGSQSKSTYVHAFVGGLSGMIAVNAFNPNANALQVFSISIIAGVSGFAFLKRSALIDDGNTDKLVGVKTEYLEEYIEKYVKPADNVAEIVDQFVSGEETIEVSLAKTLVEEETEQEKASGETITSERFEEFISDISKFKGITDNDISYIRYLYSTGMSLNNILEWLENNRR